MKTPQSMRISLSALLLAALAACGGSGPAPQAAAPAQQAVVTLTGRAVDGPLQGAIACYDLDDNGRCDAGEPMSAPTDAAGRFQLAIAPAEAGRHRVVVDVPASAIDLDTGAAVGRAFTLRAPATARSGNHDVFVSPLTTLVQAHMDHSGAALAEAVEWVRSQAGLAVSPLDDFTAGSTDAQRHAALVARLVQLTALAQAADLAGVVGSVDRLGGVVTQAVVDAGIARSLIAALPALAGAAIDPALAGANGPALQATLGVLARAMAAQVGLAPAQLLAGSTAAALAEPPFVPGVATATLRSLRYTDENNWFMRTHQASAEDNIPDAQSRVRYSDLRQQSSSNGVSANGVVSGWATGASLARAGDLHWSGSAWVDCKITDRFTTSLRDAQGRSQSQYCNFLEEDTHVRRVVDVSGRSLLEVVRDQIRTFPGANQANWGPANLGLYGSAVFPAGSALIYQTNTTIATAPNYDVQASNVVTAFNAAVAAGGDVRSNPSLACNDPAQNTSAAATPVATLEILVARNPGRPCIFSQGGVTPNFSLDPNEAWGFSTVNLGDLPGTNTLPANTGSFYTTTASLRVGFAASGSRATFYRCYRQTSNNSPRNCSLLGLGSWSIQTLGDGRVLSFSVQPALAQKLGYARVFVERGGRVYYGSKSPVGQVSTDIRLNMTAGNAVLRQLGLPSIQPVTRPGGASGERAAALATLQGVWGGADPGGTEATVFRFGPDGRFFLAEAKPFLPVTREQSGAELGWLDYDPVTQSISTVREVDSNLTSGTSHPQAGEPPITITAGAISYGGSVLANRLPTRIGSNTSLVGLWALDSATDLSVPHIAFFDNGRVMLVHHKGDPAGCLAANECPPGVELASYTFDPLSGAMRAFGMIYDTNGCTGLFDNCPTAVAQGSVNTENTLVLTVAADGLTATFLDGTLTRTLYRIAPQ